MFALFKRKPDPRPVVTVHLNARLQPVHRGAVFEDPLDAWLREEQLGEVCGGGTAFIPGKGVVSCELEVRLADLEEATLHRLADRLASIGAPSGSEIVLDDDRRMPVGAWHGLALHLNGTDLTDEVYATCDLDALFDQLNHALGDGGKAMSHYDGETETSVFVYGRSYDAMVHAIAPVLASYPLCERARVERIL